MVDVFLYNGEIKRGGDAKFIDFVFSEKKFDECLLILVTPGGSPDAAYKMARYLQGKYSKFTVMISGLCKSAGTLLAVGAHEIVFMPYGELGPLDVQMAKTDNLAGMESGLNISEAFLSLEARARETYSNMITDIIGSSGGVVSFQTASHAATEIISALYGPIFNRIDPEEVGSRSRAMRIGEDYGKRLNEKYSNLKPEALETLSQTYSSHGFVIDRLEACQLFQRIREPSEAERSIVQKLGSLARHPQSTLTIKRFEINEMPVDTESNTNAEKPTPTPKTKSKQNSATKYNGGDIRTAEAAAGS